MSKKNILFIHQNFPGQYKHLAPELAKNDNYDVTSILMDMNKTVEINNINYNYYKLEKGSSDHIHPLAVEFETKILRAEACANKAHELKDKGYIPDLIVGHTGWGEMLFLKEVWPETTYLSYVEFHYNLENSDIDFDETVFMDKTPYTRRKLIARNSSFISQYAISDYMITPTQFQKNTFSKDYRDRIEVIHEGIDTDILKPNDKASLKVNDHIINKNDKVVLLVNRSLEPYRGYHSFIKSIPNILKDHPDAYILIIGGDQKGYGADPEKGTTHREKYYNEIKDKVDTSRIFFLGLVDYKILITAFQIATVHVYLTYPFVLSWSMLESMSCGGLIVGSNTGPVTEIIEDGYNGFIVDFFDNNEISLKVSEILKNPQNFQNIKENARETIIKKYDLRKVCLPKTVKLVKNILKE